MSAESIFGGTDLAAELAGMAGTAARMVGLHMVDHVMALLGQVGAGQAAELLLPYPGEIHRQHATIVPCNGTTGTETISSAGLVP